MSDIKRLRLTRKQLALFIPNHQTIVEFERLFEENYDSSTLIENIIAAAGLNADGTYSPDVTAAYIAAAISLANADSLLDEAIWDYTRELVTTVTTNTSLSATAQTVLVDATAGNISITMPPPADCFEGGRSFRIAVHKIDTTANTVTILPNASELVVGETSQVLEKDGEIYNFITDNVDWFLGA